MPTRSFLKIRIYWMKGSFTPFLKSLQPSFKKKKKKFNSADNLNIYQQLI